MRRTFWSLMLAGVAVTAFAGFSPTTQDAEAGLFSRLRARLHGNCAGYDCAGYGACAAPVATCACPPVASCAVPAPCGACGHSPCACPTTCGCPSPCDPCGGAGGCGGDYDNDFDDDCDD
jgi:hypothetical protein